MKMELWQYIYNAYNICQAAPANMIVTGVSCTCKGGLCYVFKCQRMFQLHFSILTS